MSNLQCVKILQTQNACSSPRRCQPTQHRDLSRTCKDKTLLQEYRLHTVRLFSLIKSWPQSIERPCEFSTGKVFIDMLNGWTWQSCQTNYYSFIRPRTNVIWTLCNVQRLSVVCLRQFCGYPAHGLRWLGIEWSKAKSNDGRRACHSLKFVWAVCLGQSFRLCLVPPLFDAAGGIMNKSCRKDTQEVKFPLLVMS